MYIIKINYYNDIKDEIKLNKYITKYKNYIEQNKLNLNKKYGGNDTDYTDYNDDIDEYNNEYNNEYSESENIDENDDENKIYNNINIYNKNNINNYINDNKYTKDNDKINNNKINNDKINNDELLAYIIKIIKKNKFIKNNFSEFIKLNINKLNNNDILIEIVFYIIQEINKKFKNKEEEIEIEIINNNKNKSYINYYDIFNLYNDDNKNNDKYNIFNGDIITSSICNINGKFSNIFKSIMRVIGHTEIVYNSYEKDKKYFIDTISYSGNIQYSKYEVIENYNNSNNNECIKFHFYYDFIYILFNLEIITQDEYDLYYNLNTSNENIFDKLKKIIEIIFDNNQIDENIINQEKLTEWNKYMNVKYNFENFKNMYNNDKSTWFDDIYYFNYNKKKILKNILLTNIQDIKNLYYVCYYKRTNKNIGLISLILNCLISEFQDLFKNNTVYHITYQKLLSSCNIKLDEKIENIQLKKKLENNQLDTLENNNFVDLLINTINNINYNYVIIDNKQIDKFKLFCSTHNAFIYNTSFNIFKKYYEKINNKENNKENNKSFNEYCIENKIENINPENCFPHNLVKSNKNNKCILKKIINHTNNIILNNNK